MSSETLAIESSGGRPDVAATVRRASALTNSPLARWLKVVSSSSRTYPGLPAGAFTAVGRVHQGSALCLVPHALGAPARPDWAGPPSPSAATDAPERAARERGASEERGNGTREARAVATGADDAVERKSRRRRLEDGRGRAQQALALHRAARAGGYTVPCQHPTAFPVISTQSSLEFTQNVVIYAFSTLKVSYGMVVECRACGSRAKQENALYVPISAARAPATRAFQATSSARRAPWPTSSPRPRTPPRPSARLVRVRRDRAPLFFRDVPDVGFHLRPLCPLTRPDRGSDARRAPWRRPWSTRASPRRQRTTRTTRSAAFSLTCTPATASP